MTNKIPSPTIFHTLPSNVCDMTHDELRAVMEGNYEKVSNKAPSYDSPEMNFARTFSLPVQKVRRYNVKTLEFLFFFFMEEEHSYPFKTIKLEKILDMFPYIASPSIRNKLGIRRQIIRDHYYDKFVPHRDERTCIVVGYTEELIDKVFVKYLKNKLK